VGYRQLRFTSQPFSTFFLLAALTQAACVGPTLPPLQPDRPIEIQHGFLGARYEQDGKPVDPADTLEHLEKDRAAAPAASRYKTLMVVTTGLAAVGGGLIGWPLGQQLAGKEKPIWPLAYAGAVSCCSPSHSGCGQIPASIAQWRCSISAYRDRSRQRRVVPVSRGKIIRGATFFCNLQTSLLH
jgi:hypothetical protein